MTIESMKELILIQETLDKADEVQKLLIGSSFALGFKDGIFGTMTYTWNIIRRECDQKLNDTSVDMEDRDYYKILNSKELSLEDKAIALLGGLLKGEDV